MPQKTWVVGEEVLAADFNTYVQNQVVAKFATVAARDAAWPAATAGPGAMSVTTDTNTLWLVVGVAWVAAGGAASPWIAPTLLNGWINYGSGLAPAGYRKIRDIVYLRGMIKSGTVGASAFALPAAYQPPQAIQFPATTGAFSWITVGTDVTISSGPATGITFGNMSWSTTL